MAVDVNIRHTLDATNFESVFNAFNEKLAAIVDTFNVGQTRNAQYTAETEIPQKNRSSIKDADILSNTSKMFDATFSKFKELDITSLSNKQLFNQIKGGATKLSLIDDPKAGEIIKSLNENIRQYQKTEITNEQLNERLRSLKDELPTPERPVQADNFNKNLMRSIFAVELAGGLAKVGGLVAAQGGIAGSAAQSLNTGVLSSSAFINDYQSRMLQNQQDIKNTIGSTLGVAGGMAAGGLLGAQIGMVGGPVGAGIGAAVGGGAAALYSYFGNKNIQEQISSNRFLLDADENAWRLNNTIGIGTTGSFRGKQLGANIGDRYYKTNLAGPQADLLNDPKLAAFGQNYADYALNANRQLFNNGGNNSQNIGQSVTAGKLLGFNDSNIGQFINLATTTAMASGQNLNTTLNQLLDVNKRYGGDTAKNTALAVQLMQNSNVGSFQNALEEVNRYQYNPAALQNVVSGTKTSPTNKWIASQFGSLLGLSDQEINSGVLNNEHIAEYRKGQSSSRGSADPRYLMFDYFANLRGQDLNVNQAGVMDKITMAKGNPIENAMSQLPATMQAMTDNVIDSLKNLKVGTQTVYADVVNIDRMKGGNNNAVSSPSISSRISQANQRLNSNSGSGVKNGHMSNAEINSQRQEALEAINNASGTHYNMNNLPER